MASLKRVTHKNGRIVYRIVISLGYDEQGHRRTKHFTCSVNQSASPRQQEREALKYAMDLEDRLKYGHTPADSHMFFEEFASQWLENEKENLAAGTYVGYEQLLRKKILPYFKGYRIAHVRTPDIEAFYQMLTGEYAPGTIRRYANVLNRIFGTARRWNLIEANPCQNARKPKKLKETENLRYFTPRQALIFLKSLELTYEEDCEEHSEAETGENTQVSESSRRIYRVPIQYRVFYTLSLFCGFRKGETLALHWEDIDFGQREISVSKAIGRTEHGFDYKEPKNRISVRKVPFPESILPLLVEYRVTLELQGYNVYREGKLLNFSPVTDNEYVDGDVEEGNDYTYALTTLWDKGESGLSKSITVRAASGVEGVSARDIRITALDGAIRVDGGCGETVCVYSADGILVASAVADGTVTVPVSAGFYVVRAGSAVARVAVR